MTARKLQPPFTKDPQPKAGGGELLSDPSQVVPHASFELTSLIHDSSKSQIYRGVAKSDKRSVIIKMLKASTQTSHQLAHLRREFELLQELAGLPVPRAIELTTIDGVAALVLEDVQAISLRELLARAPLPLASMLALFQQMATALAELHARGVIHKDINPANVVVEPGSHRLFLIDLGIAAKLTREQVAFSVIETLEGTLNYISPEQTGRTGHPLDERTDLYSMGATFYEVLTGSLPFVGRDAIELVHAHLARDAKPPHEIRPELPQVLSRLVMKLLAKAPEARYRSALGVAHDLEKIAKLLEEKAPQKPFVADFELASHDVPLRLSLPQRLYGRDVERAQLLEAFAHVEEGGSAMVLIAGPSGVGKTSLILDIAASLLRSHTHFTEGKFEELRRDIPYDAIVRALRGLVVRMQAEPEEKMTAWRQAIFRAVAPNCQVLIDVIPELGPILGPQAPLADLSPNAAKYRFHQCFVGLVRASTEDGRPLVLFLDDLQWADFASLSLLGQLVQDAAQGRILVIGAYRAHEVTPSHPFWAAREDWQKAEVRSTVIELGPMTEESVASLCADTLLLPLDKTRELAAVVSAKTGGNPFFVQQFLRSLYRDHALIFDVAKGHWTIDLEKVRAAALTDNVIDLLSTRLTEFAPRTREVLGAAALCGASFNLKILSLVMESSLLEVARALEPAIEEDLLIPIGSAYRYVEAMAEECANDADRLAAFGREVRYRFSHDRVQEASDRLLAPQGRLEAQLRIGRILARASQDVPFGSDEGMLALGHLSAAEALIKDAAERRDIARLHLDAGQRAKAATAWAIGDALFAHGITFLGEDAWQTDRALARGLYLGAGACAMLAGRHEVAEDYFKILLDKAHSNFEVAEIQYLRLVLLVAMVKSSQAISAGIAGLAALGIKVPARVAPISTALAFVQVTRKIQRMGVDNILALPDANTPENEMALRIFTELAHPCAMVQTYLAGKLVCMEVDFVLERGHSKWSAHAFMQLAIGMAAFGVHVYLPIVKRSLILDLQNLWLELSQRSGEAENQVRQDYTYLFACAQWRPGYAKLAEKFDAMLEPCVAKGDIVFAMYSLVTYANTAFFMGENLNTIDQMCEKRLAYVEQTKHEPYYSTWKLVFACGKALLADDPQTARQLADSISGTWDRRFDENTGPTTTLLMKGILHLFVEEYDKAYQSLKECYRGQINSTFFGSFKVAAFVVFFSLSIAGLWSRASFWKRIPLAFYMIQMRLLGRVFAAMSEENFGHMRRLIDAVSLHAMGARPARYGKLYAEAMAMARAQGYTSIEALAAEGMGRALLADGHKVAALGPLMVARQAYERWGIRSKVRAIESLHPELARVGNHRAVIQRAATAERVDGTAGGASSSTANQLSHRRTTDRHAPMALDAPTLIRASQVLSGEIHLVELKRKLMHLVCENAGARRALLVWAALGEKSEKEAVYRIEACAVSEGELTVDVDSRELSPELMSLAALNYVLRTRETLLVGEVKDDGTWQNDAALRARKVRSVLCMPIVMAGVLKGVIYLEHELIPHAFSSDRVQVLSLLAGQIAISLDNALLYARLEASLIAEKEARAKEQSAHRDYVASERARQQLVTSLEAAEAVQKALLVVHPPLLGYELAHIYRPAERAGGDWLGCYVDERRRAAYVILGDVTGHGISSALVTAAAAGAAASAVAQIIGSKQTFGLEAAVRHIAWSMHQAVRRTGEPSEHLMTMTMVGIDLDSGAGHYLNAGHNPIFLVGKEVHHLLVGGNPLGLAPAPFFGESSFAMAAGDRVFLYSDGLLSNYNVQGKSISQRRLGKLLLEVAEPQKLIVQLTQIVDAFVVDAATDDTSAFALRWLGPTFAKDSKS